MGDTEAEQDQRRQVDRGSLMHRLRERGVLRVAASYAVIAWLGLQIASVVFDPLGVPRWVMTTLIVATAVGFPVAIALAWFLELGQHGVSVDAAADGRVRPHTVGWRRFADVIVIGVLVVTVAVLLVKQSGYFKPKPPASPAIAVLPFDNLSGDPGQDYFADGLAEEMLDRLGHVPGLRVIGRSSSFGFKGKDIDIKDVATRLAVTTVLEGSVRRAGQRLKLNARLIDGATGQQVWSGSFDRELNDIFAVQAELAAAVVNAIVPTARGDTVVENTPPPTMDLNAYDLYLLARSQLALRSPGSIRKSVELSEQAVQRDPNFARAHAHLAASLLFARLYDVDPQRNEEFVRRAEQSIYRALALDPKLSEAYDAQGNLLRDTERSGAEDAYKRAIALNPNNASAWHDYSVFLGNSARKDESTRATMRSLELDPRQPIVWSNYLMAVQKQGRKRFEEEYARGVRTVGDLPGALYRFPQPVWAHDREGVRSELVTRIDGANNDADMLDGLTMPFAAIRGYPVEVMRAALKKPVPQGDTELPLAFNHYRAWLPVDAQRAAQALDGPLGVHHGVNYDVTKLFMRSEAAGLQQDWTRLDDALGQLQRAPPGPSEKHLQSVRAFWLAVRGRYEEAASSLAQAQPLDDQFLPPVLGGDRQWGLLETITVRVLRGTGRKDEADRYAAKTLAQLRHEWRDASKTCEWDGWMMEPMRYPSFAASEGLKQEAVAALQDALRCGDLPYGFFPQLPWFRSLEGYAPYDALLRERASRVERARADLERLIATEHNPAPRAASATATR